MTSVFGLLAGAANNPNTEVTAVPSAANPKIQPEADDNSKIKYISVYLQNPSTNKLSG